MRSSLTGAYITNIDGSPWTAAYGYKKDGNIYRRTINGVPESFEYNTDATNGTVFDSDIITSVGGNGLGWDLNGRLTDALSAYFEYTWDGMLNYAEIDTNWVVIRYDPRGNRVCKYSTINGDRYYIVDIVGKLPTILCEIDPTDSSLKNSYIYANGQILCQYQGETDPNRYFYIHDRLGSVRLVISDAADVNNSYTYSPFGEPFASECTALGAPYGETVYNPFLFTGQWYDSEIRQYYLRARQYSPYLGRFTSRDPVKGQFKFPLTLHRYLYCNNSPANFIDPSGESLSGATLVKPIAAGYSVHFSAIAFATYGVASGNERFLNLAIGMEAMVGPVVLLAFGWTTVEDIIGGVDGEVRDNYMGSVSNLPPWIPKYTKIAIGLTILATIMRGCNQELELIQELPTPEDWQDIQPRWNTPPDEQEPPGG
jgi:RHS repeat-associated protein